MKKLLSTLIVIFIIAASALKSQAQTGESFDFSCLPAGTTDASGTTVASYALTSSNCPAAAGFTAETDGATSVRVFSTSFNGTSYLRLDKVGASSTWNYSRLYSTSGTTFTLTGISITPSSVSGGAQTLTVHAYLKGSEVGSVTTASLTVFGFVPVTLNSSFANIDEVRFTSSLSGAFGVGITDVVTAAGPTITSSATGTLAALSTTSGTASSTDSFNLSGTSLTAGVTVTPPAGFEVSSTSSTSGFGGAGNSITVGSPGTLASTAIYVRLAATDGVNSYSGNIALTSSGATEVDVPIASSSVTSPAPTATSISSSLNPSFTASPNNSVTFTATVTHSGLAVTEGTVSFTSNGAAISNGSNIALNGSGQAAVTTSFSATGPYTILATYNGDANYSGSSQSLSQQVNVHPTTISSLTTGGGTLTNASQLTYTATFASAISGLSTSNFSLSGTATGATIASVSPSSGSSTSFTVTVNTGSTDGTIILNFANQTGLSPGVSNTLSASTITVDKTAPTVISIQAISPSNTTTNATSVTYLVTFSENVTGASSDDFAPTTSGVNVTSIAVNPSTSTTYTVTVNGVIGNGTLRLDFTGNAEDVTDAAGNIATAHFTSGDVYTIDQTAPTVIALTYSSNNSTNGAFAQISNAITLSFITTEAIQAPAVTIAGHTVTASQNGGDSYSASYIMTSSDTEGRIPFSLTIKDQAGNSSSYTDVSEGDDLTFDMTPPMAAIGPPTQNSISGNGIGSITYVVTYSDENFNTSTLTNLGINVYTTGTVAATLNVSGSGTSYNVTFSNITGSGKLSFGVKPGYATDDAGNFDSGVSPSQQVTVLGIDPTLSNLTLSNGTLTPGFSSTTTSYTAAVGNGLSSITVNPTTNDPNATVTVNGNPASTAVPLTVGTNNITIVVTAGDGVTQKTYNLTVTEVQSYNDNLASVRTSAGLAQGATVPATMTESVVNSITSLTVTPTVADPTAMVTVNGMVVTSGQPSDIILLNVGQNTITIVVTAQDTRTQTYTITVTRAPSANNKLSNLVVSSGTLSPAFGTATNYLDYIANGIQFSVTPTTADPTATVTVNGTAATSGTPTMVPLTVGNNTILIVVTAQNTTATKTYTLVVNEARSPNSTLFSLTTSGGFSQGQTVPTTLTESVPNSTTSITVTPTMADNTATVTVNGVAVTSGSPSNSINLNVGANTITIVGTAQAGNTTTYTLTVTRAASSLLTNLTSTAGTLTPAFASTTTGYATYAPNGTTSTTITPTAVDPNATIKVNGNPVASGSASGAIALAVGNNPITVAVTAADNSTTTTYTVTVNVARSPNSTLYSLTTSGGFSQGQTVPATLTESVPNATSGITVSPTMADPNATVTVNGVAVTSGSTSNAINLNVGQNTITIIGTAQAGNTTTYTLTVTRAASSQLTNIALSTGTLSPTFASGTTTYNAGVGYGVGSITLTPTAIDPNATIKVNGSTVTSGNASGAISLIIGNTNITVAVTAADNSTTTTYTITANEARSSDDALLSFKTSAGLAKGKTVPTTLTESVVNATSSITITPTVDDPTATVTVNGVAVTSGTASASIPLAVGNTAITTIVTAQTGVTQTYTLTVTRAPGSANNVYEPVSVGVQNFEPQLADDGINVHQGVSPNGDGVNDYLQIDNISQYPENHLSIMTRNGLLVYEAKGYDNATKVFDGHSNKTGQMQLPGTYFYELDYTANGVIKHKTGYLVLKY